MAQKTYPRTFPPSEALRKDMAHYFPLWTVMELTLTQLRGRWYSAKWTVAWNAKQHTFEAAGVSVLDLENRMLEVMRRKLDPMNRVAIVRSAS